MLNNLQLIQDLVGRLGNSIAIKDPIRSSFLNIDTKSKPLLRKRIRLWFGYQNQ